MKRKYRIKIVQDITGKKLYYPQARILFIWFPFHYHEYNSSVYAEMSPEIFFFTRIGCVRFIEKQREADNKRTGDKKIVSVTYDNLL